MLVGEPLYLVLILPLAVGVNLLPSGLPRALVLLLASYAFYCTFSAVQLPILLFITGIAFAGGIVIERAAKSRWNNLITAAAIAICLAPLISYKYLLPLAWGTFRVGANWQLTPAELTNPIGLSFYTFAALGYLADVALGVTAAEYRPFRLALFCGFFPIVTSGPIPRTTTVLPQLDFRRPFTSERGMQAVTEILAGTVMKLWIANSLGVSVASVFSDLAHCSALERLTAIILFAFQLYADFAGYSLIAIGSARLFGVDIPPNFRQPFLAGSIAEFWRRWHISLLIWLRDYVYMPLSVSWRRYRYRWLANAAAAFITLVLVGIWHGAGWGFVMFGVVHGLLVIYSSTLKGRDKLWAALKVPALAVRVIRVPITFLVVALTFVLIRAHDLGEALSIYRSIFNLDMVHEISRLLRFYSGSNFAFVHLNATEFGMDLVLVAALLTGDVLARSKRFDFFALPAPARAVFYTLCVMTVLYQVISANAPQPFVYFQF
jgi:alginate O-acetyltransferase complex protein AlgI